MAGRNATNTVEYFPHYISDGKKMFYVEQKYGNDGYAVWFKLLESLASTEYHYLDLQNESDLMYLSAKCRVEQDVLISILDDLAKFNEIDKQLWTERIIWSEKFVESVQDAYARRKNKCMQKKDLCKHLLHLCRLKYDLCSPTVNINTQSKVKYSKVNQSKVINATTEIFNFRSKLLTYGFEKTLVSDWLAVRQKKRLANTETAYNGFINQIQEAVSKTGLSINEILTQCVEDSWGGFKCIWLINKIKNDGQSKENNGASRSAVTTQSSRKDFD
jgi:hypothetical protein